MLLKQGQRKKACNIILCLHSSKKGCLITIVLLFKTFSYQNNRHLHLDKCYHEKRRSEVKSGKLSFAQFNVAITLLRPLEDVTNLPSVTRFQCNKTFYGRKLQIFVIS
jgi:hypothetical protein